MEYFYAPVSNFKTIFLTAATVPVSRAKCCKYISWENIEKIRKKDFNHALDIFFEILKPNFMKSPHLKDKYFLIKGVHTLRNLVSHGSSNNIDSELAHCKNRYAKTLYYDTDNYTKIKEVVSWFVQEAYKRINKLKTI